MYDEKLWYVNVSLLCTVCLIFENLISLKIYKLESNQLGEAERSIFLIKQIQSDSVPGGDCCIFFIVNEC